MTDHPPEVAAWEGWPQISSLRGGGSPARQPNPTSRHPQLPLLRPAAPSECLPGPLAPHTRPARTARAACSQAVAQPRPLPPSTAWNAALVDYIYTSGKAQGYEPGPSYTYYTLASDHLPLVHDLTPVPHA